MAAFAKSWRRGERSRASLLGLALRSADKEIFQDELAIYCRERLLADPAMDQSMREVGVSFHAHHLVVRPAARADITQSNRSQPFTPHPIIAPTVAAEKNLPPIEVDFLDGAVVSGTNCRARRR